MFPSGKIIGSDTDSGLYVIKPNFTLTGNTNGYTNNIVPENYFLDQNRPNPFNPTTNIKFSIPENSTIKLNVYNLAGQDVGELINDRRDAGNYEITFDAGRYGLSSGIYFYTLTTGSGFRETKKMILVK